MAQSLAFSRRLISRSTASCTKAVRVSPSPRTASMRSKVPCGKRPAMLSKFSFGRPMRGAVADISLNDKLISPIDDVSDIRFIDDIRYGDKAMTFPLDKTGIVRGDYNSTGYLSWDDLSPLTQGYVDAAKDWCDLAVGEAMPVDWGFSHLASDTLAHIISDCERFLSMGLGENDYTHGVRFWQIRTRQQVCGGFHPAFPPLSIHLGDDGKVVFA